MHSLNRLKKQDEPYVVADGFDDCIIGFIWRDGHKIAVYDASQIVNQLARQGMSQEDALEHFYFNIAGAYVGPQTPVYLTDGLF